MVQSASPNDGAVINKRKVSTNFCSNILKVLVGEDKAKAAFQSISMGAIPKQLTPLPKTFSAGNFGKSHTLSEMGDMFNNRLADFKNKIKNSE